MKIRNPEWRDELDSTRYPFSDDATMTSEAGNFLSELVLIDAVLYPIGATLPLRLSSVVVSPGAITVFVSDTNDDISVQASFSAGSIPDNLKLIDEHGRTAGLLVSSAIRLATLVGLPSGTHIFSEDATTFALSCCHPLPSGGVEGFVLDDGTVLSGDVVLVADDGVVFSHSQVVSTPANPYYSATTFEQIRVDIVGDPLFRRRLCTDSEQFVSPTFIQRICINTPEILEAGELPSIDSDRFCITPDEYGDIRLIAGTQDASDSVLRIYPVDEGLMFRAVGERTRD